MDVVTLKWDSEFFGLRIGRVDIYTQEDICKLKQITNKLQQEFDVLYLFDNSCIRIDILGATLVDEKVLYRKECEHRQAYEDVVKYDKERPTDALYHLAYVSGKYSRFKIDSHFAPRSYERLYKRWIENSCPRPESNKQIFVYRTMSIEKGMITIDYHTTVSAQIGLVAVDTDIQHNGIGTIILSTAEEYLYQLGIKTLDVYTQKANKKACLWYEKNGFKAANIVNIYHWWLKN